MVTRDTLKAGVNLPIFGAISIGSVILVGAIVWYLTRRRGTTFTLR